MPVLEEEVVERVNSGPTFPDDVCEIWDLGESSNQSPSEPESEPEPVRELDVTAKESVEGKVARTRKRKTKYPCISCGKPHRKGCRAVSQNVPVSQMHLQSLALLMSPSHRTNLSILPKTCH